MSVSKLSIVNALLPKDAASKLAAAGIPYGGRARQRLDIYTPKNVAAPLPVVIFFYGGSWSWGERGDYAFAGRALAALGMVAVIADYRLVPVIEYPLFLDDNADAVRWTGEHIAEFGGDPGSIFIAGHSAGAYNAAMLALDPRYGALRSSMRGVIGLAGPYDFLPLDSPVTRRVFGGADDLAATQPVNLVSAAAPPMFLAAGASDWTVYPRNTIALARALRTHGVDAVERHYRGLGHAGLLLALSRPFRHRAPLLDEIAAFAGIASREADDAAGACLKLRSA